MNTLKDPFISELMSDAEIDHLEHHLNESCNFPMSRACRKAVEELVRAFARTLELENPGFDTQAFCDRVLNTTGKGQ